MADNLPVTPGAGANVATNEILGVHFPRSKMVIGEDGVNDGDVSADNPCPMQIYGTHAYADHADLHAVKVTDDGEIATTNTERERNIHVHYVELGITSNRYIMMVDLSDTVNWPHEYTGRVDVSSTEAQINISSVSGATGTLRLGVVTRIDGTDADIIWVDCAIFNKNGATDIERSFNYSPSQLKLGVSGGKLVKSVSNAWSYNVAEINSVTPLDTANDALTAIPAVGDLILFLEVSAGTVSFIYDIMYHTEDSV